MYEFLLLHHSLRYISHRDHIIINNFVSLHWSHFYTCEYFRVCFYLSQKKIPWIRILIDHDLTNQFSQNKQNDQFAVMRLISERNHHHSDQKYNEFVHHLNVVFKSIENCERIHCYWSSWWINLQYWKNVSYDWLLALIAKTLVKKHDSLEILWLNIAISSMKTFQPMKSS